MELSPSETSCHVVRKNAKYCGTRRPLRTESTWISKKHFNIIVPSARYPKWHLASCFSTRVFCAFLISPFVPHAPPSSSALIWPSQCLVKTEAYEAVRRGTFSVLMPTSSRLGTNNFPGKRIKRPKGEEDF